jgi:hypothetical protein
MVGNIIKWKVKTTISDLIEVGWSGRVIVKHLLSDISSRKNIVNISWKFKIINLVRNINREFDIEKIY